MAGFQDLSAIRVILIYFKGWQACHSESPALSKTDG